MRPRLSICVPSRNRQTWFAQTINALLENPRDDLEFVFADNSDDATIMADVIKAHRDDPRVVFLPPARRSIRWWTIGNARSQPLPVTG